MDICEIKECEILILLRCGWLLCSYVYNLGVVVRLMFEKNSNLLR